MIDGDLLRVLCCPESHQELRPADAATIWKLNQRIAAGAARNRGGRILQEPIDGGLIRADNSFLYPLRGQIPILLVEEAIPLAAS